MYIGRSLFCFYFSFQQFFLFLPIMLNILLEAAVLCSKVSYKIIALIFLLKYINPILNKDFMRWLFYWSISNICNLFGSKNKYLGGAT